MSISSINQNVQQNNKSSYVKKGLLGTGIGAAGGAAVMGAFSYIDIQNTKGFIPNKDTFMQQFKDEDMFKQIKKQLNESLNVDKIYLYFENDNSYKVKNRKGLKKLMKDYEKNRIDIIALENFDALGKKKPVIYEILKDFHGYR